MRMICSLAFVACILGFAGCASYVTPGPRAELDLLAPPDIREGFAKEPAAGFPANIVAVRLQGADYSNYRFRRGGAIKHAGKYTVVLAREVEKETDIKQLADLPKVGDVISLNSMLLPDKVRSYDDLRPAASKLRADMMFVYTFDTRFFKQDDAKPLTVVSLGILPTKVTTATTTASALLIDTRTGFMYGAFEATVQKDLRSSSWGSGDAADQTRLATEKEAFQKLIKEVIDTWPRILEGYAASDPEG